MIKVRKELTQVPVSLNTQKTREKRCHLVANEAYLKRFDKTYKTEDIKNQLLKIYHDKCCYCEQDVSDQFFPVEHYRPKSKYYWLAFSWDNLLLCCSLCNCYKSDHFEIKGCNVDCNEDDFAHIHQLAEQYNKTEQPMMIHPELEDVGAKLTFDQHGKVSSLDERVQYTIDICKIDRPRANNRRKKLLDNLLNDYQERLHRYQLTLEKKYLDDMKHIIRAFQCAAENDTSEYSAFRRYVVDHLDALLRSNGI